MTIRKEDLIKTLAEESSKNQTLKRKLEAELYKKDFKAFIKAFWGIIEPGSPYSHNWHIDYLTEEVLSMFGHIPQIREIYPNADWDKINEETSRRMVINVPTRSMKTLLISVFLPTWLVLHDPTLRIATVSYAEDLSIMINNKRRTIITSDKYQELFGDIVRPDQGSNRQDRIEFESRGVMYSVSITGRFTGMGADIIILDDPQKPGEMGTPSEREKAIKFFKDTLPTRLDNRNTGVIINIQQRLHFEDLTGYILENSPYYQLVKIPLEFEYDETYVAPLSGTEYVVNQGDVLWEARFNRTSVDMLKSELGSQNFQAQQQQEPTPDGGAILERSWFREYSGTPVEFLKDLQEHEPERFGRMRFVLSWDMNYTVNVKNDSDFIGYVAGLHDPETDETYILDSWKRRLGFNDTVQTVLRERAKYEDYERPIIVLIEKKANGGPIIQLLEQKVAGIKPFEPGTKNKVARMESTAPTIESGHVFFPAEGKGIIWREKLMADLIKFPYIRHDDAADAFSQLIIHNHITDRRTNKSFKVFF